MLKAGKMPPAFARLAVLLLVAACALPAVAARRLETYTVHYADVQQMQAVVRGYLSSGSSVSVYQNRLVVNGTDREQAKTGALLRQLDVGGRQLMIFVRTGGGTRSRRRDIRASGSVTTGHGVETRTRATVTLRSRQSRRGESGGQGVRATEGRPAYIGAGGSAPINQYTTTVDGRVIRSQTYVSTETGFYATAWVNENRVRVHIEQQRQRLENGGAIRGQQLQSEVEGVLGAWIPIGMVVDGESAVGGGAAQGDVQRRGVDTIYLKVELSGQ